jgi:SAM-dependent methyltransferase
MPAWFENEEFWLDSAPVMFDENRWAETGTIIDLIEKLARWKPGMRILDACCGVGRHAVELAARGYRVTGVDLTAGYLEAARESARAEGVSLEFVRADVRNFVRRGAFDGAINLFSSFGYFEDPGHDLVFLRNIFKSLVPGGRLVMDLLGKEIEARDFVASERFARAGFRVLSECAVIDGWSALAQRWVFVKGKRKREYRLERRLYSGRELSELLLKAGFSSAEIYGDYSGAPYDEKASLLVAVALKGERAAC